VPVYTAEIGDRPVAAIQADNLREAEKFFLSGTFSTDLRTLEMKGGEPGKPIWDREAEIAVRDPSPEEVATWQRFRSKAISDGVTTPDDEAFATFLDAVREIKPGSQA
jgi:hypothetical protein